MPAPAMPASQVLDREFLELRAKLLELAGSFDRLDRGDGSVADDPRMKLIHEAVRLLESDSPNRAERLQLLFSRPYDAEWRSRYGFAE